MDERIPGQPMSGEPKDENKLEESLTENEKIIRSTDWYQDLSFEERSNLDELVKELDSQHKPQHIEGVSPDTLSKDEVFQVFKEGFWRCVQKHSVKDFLYDTRTAGDDFRQKLISDPDINKWVRTELKKIDSSSSIYGSEIDYYCGLFNIDFDREIKPERISSFAQEIDTYNDLDAEKLILFAGFRRIGKEDLLKSKEINDALIQLAVSKIINGNIQYAHKTIEKFRKLNQSLVWEAGLEGIRKLGEQGTWFRLVQVADVFDIPTSELAKSDIQEAVVKALPGAMAESSALAQEIISKFLISAEGVKKAAQAGAVEQLKRENWNIVIRLIDEYQFDTKIFEKPELREVVMDNLVEAVIFYARSRRNGLPSKDPSLRLFKHFNTSEEENARVIQRALCKELSKTDFGTASIIISNLLPNGSASEFIQSDEAQNFLRAGIVRQIDNEFHPHHIQGDSSRLDHIKDIFGLKNEDIDDKYPEVIKGLATNFEFNNLDGLKEFIKLNPEFYEFVKDSDISPILKKSDLAEVKKLHLSLSEAELLLRGDFNLEELKDPKVLYEALKHHCREWNDFDNIQNPFQLGAEIFGYERMFAYIDRAGLSRHDALHQFSWINKLAYTDSELTPNHFYGNILFQVMKDDAQYDEGTAHHKLNAIASTFPDVETTLVKARENSQIKLLGELAETFKSRKDIFSSWKNLKRFHELAQILERAETLEKLKELRKIGKDKIADFVETLAFHPNSSVDMQSAVLFMEDPERFFDLEDNHAPESHERKKPSNYTQIPYLDLTAEQLRDALVEGPLDQLQVFKPMEIEYTFGGEVDLESQESLREQFQKAIGSRQKGIAGQAKNSKKLFSEMQRILKSRDIDGLAWLLGQADLPEDANLKKEMIDMLFHKDTGIVRSKAGNGRQVTYIAKINFKSNPDGVLAGNDTACCMPFGSGKNNVYMTNPDTALFTIQVRRPDSVRTIAQSVLTKDIDVGRPIPEIIQDLNEAGKHIDQVIPPQILNSHQSVLACDNIEINPNYKDAETLGRIAQIYRDFFAEYFKHQPEPYNPKVVIGTGYTDLDVPMNKQTNTYAPKAPVGYSDKTGPEVFVIDTKDITPLANRHILKRASESKESRPTTGVLPLTFEDSLPVAYIEGKAYKDNESLMTYLHNMENGLIAKDINNEAKGRPNLSLKYVDEKGRMRGYLFAYEGEREGRSVIFISDLASDKESRLAGGRLIHAFVELYRENYLKQGKAIPIFTNARDKTSYRIIQKQIDNIAAELGVQFQIEEVDSEYQGGELMHDLLIKPVLDGR